MKFPTIDELAKNVAEKALDEIYGGKTIREWIEILVKQQPFVIPQPKTGHWLRMSDLSEQEDDRYKCSYCGNVIHHKNKMNLNTFNSWCGRCGSDNGRKRGRRRMTDREAREAIKKLKDILAEATENDDSVCYVTSNDADILKAAIKALEQESCEDCISRQAAIALAKDICVPTKDGTVYKHRCIDLDEIRELPPVTSKPKIGEWINDRCSECGKGIEDLIVSSEWYRNENPKYCPFCGIKIQEVGKWQ